MIRIFLSSGREVYEKSIQKTNTPYAGLVISKQKNKKKSFRTIVAGAEDATWTQCLNEKGEKGEAETHTLVWIRDHVQKDKGVFLRFFETEFLEELLKAKKIN
jgi:hypothetical protein